MSLTSRQIVQLRIGDTGATLFTSDQIDSFIEQADEDVNLATAYALRALAADYARCAIIAKDGDFSRDVRSVPRELNRQADAWERRSVEDPAFGVGLANNPISSINDVFSNHDILVEE